MQTYDPFGAPLASQPANATEHLFTGRWGKQYDTTSSLVLMGTRPYDPNLGRFLAVDPVDGGSLNAYDYAGQDPTNGYDLDGRMLENDDEAADYSSITITYPIGDHGTDTITFIAKRAGSPYASVVGQIHVVKTGGYRRTYATVKVETAKPVKSGTKWSNKGCAEGAGGAVVYITVTGWWQDWTPSGILLNVGGAVGGCVWGGFVH